ncbi:MAG: hypothetical protein DMD90_11640 [Candidatus Rokuibacteriota bacterium]|nr:MAG: hypothetical protein AUH76_02400 [Candidatus Rokubacteria bacterium 13_1_40CM_4_67_11]PYN64859.1 MAG: hypothetical protein DMD90_11640 [Candidatus Rokubacteria bacterium]
MRINFLVPGLAISGGNRIIFEYANRLGARGHAVTIVAPTEWPGPAPRRSPRQRLAALGRYLLANRRVAWFDLDVALKIVPSLAERHVPDADVTIATYWRTAEAQAQYGPRKGVPVYFIQGYEIWGGAREEVEATYRGPAIKFAVSSWLKRLLRDRFDQDPVGPMVQGVNFEQFHHEARAINDPPRIGMLYRDTTWRGTTEGLHAVELVRKKYPGVRLVMFGQGWPWIEAPADVEYHHDPPQDELRKIYGSCDIWINPSWHEGLPLPPMEAMACRCAVVTTNVGTEDYLVPGETALVVPPRDAEAIADAILTLLDDRRRLQAVAEAGHRHIRTFTWERAVLGFERALEDVVRARR